MSDTSGAIPLFGPAGNSVRFYQQGFSRTAEAFSWQKPMGLTAYEYPFGRGVRISAQTARKIGRAAGEAGVALSAHAPYYINLAGPDPEQLRKSVGYVLHTARMLSLMGGERLVLHTGSPKGLERAEAFRFAEQGIQECRRALLDEGMGHIRLCPGTMGRPSVIGTLKEVLSLCGLDESFIPCIDFAHLHAASGGALNGPGAFAAVLDEVETALGITRARAMHAHFSHIEFGPKGEVKHRIFADEGYGPDFAHLAPLLRAREYHPVIICESRGTMAEDAAPMRGLYLKASFSLTAVAN